MCPCQCFIRMSIPLNYILQERLAWIFTWRCESVAVPWPTLQSCVLMRAKMGREKCENLSPGIQQPLSLPSAGILLGVSVVQVKHSLQEEALHSHQARGIWRVQSPHLGGRGGRMEHTSRLHYLAAEDCLEWLEGRGGVER